MNHPTATSVVFHILRKDLLHYRWAWIGLIVASLMQILLYGTGFGLTDAGWLQALEAVLGSGKFLVGFFLIVLVVQEEPLANPDASWVARPIPRLSLFAAKWIFCLLVIALLNATTSAAIVSLNGGVHRAVFPFIGIVGVSIYIAFQILLASQTRSLPRYLAALVALVITLWIGGAVLLGWLFSTFRDWDLGLLPADLGSFSILWIQTAWWLLLGILLGAFYYKTRRRLPLLAILVAGVVGSLMLKPRDQAALEEIFTDDSELTMEVVGHRLVRVSSGSSSHEGDFTTYGLDVRFPDLQEGGEMVAELLWMNVSQDGRSVPGEPQTYAGTLTPRTTDESGSIYRLELFSLWDDQLVTLREGPLSLRFHLRIYGSRERELLEISLDETGHIVNRGDRIAVTGRSRADDRLRVKLRHVIPNFVYEPTVAGMQYNLGQRYGFVLRDEDTDNRVPGRISGSYNMGLSGQSASESTLEFTVPADLNENRASLLVSERILNLRGQQFHTGEYDLPGRTDEAKQKR